MRKGVTSWPAMSAAPALGGRQAIPAASAMPQDSARSAPARAARRRSRLVIPSFLARQRASTKSLSTFVGRAPQRAARRPEDGVDPAIASRDDKTAPGRGEGRMRSSTPRGHYAKEPAQLVSITARLVAGGRPRRSDAKEMD